MWTWNIFPKWKENFSSYIRKFDLFYSKIFLAISEYELGISTSFRVCWRKKCETINGILWNQKYFIAVQGFTHRFVLLDRSLYISADFLALDRFSKLPFPILFSSPDHDFIFQTLLIVALNSISSSSRSPS